MLLQVLESTYEYCTYVLEILHNTHTCLKQNLLGAYFVQQLPLLRVRVLIPVLLLSSMYVLEVHVFMNTKSSTGTAVSSIDPQWRRERDSVSVSLARGGHSGDFNHHLPLSLLCLCASLSLSLSLSLVSCLLSLVSCLLSLVSCLLSLVKCHSSIIVNFIIFSTTEDRCYWG